MRYKNLDLDGIAIDFGGRRELVIFVIFERRELGAYTSFSTFVL